MFADADVVPVRLAVGEACSASWDRLALPGTWWAGAERIEIAHQARVAKTCDLCAERKAAVTPYLVPRTHDPSKGLSSAAVDAIHRIVTDPGRLTARWVNEVFASGIEPGAFVELVGVISTAIMVDTLARGIGVPPRVYPAPVSGEPRREDIPGAAISGSGAWVPTPPPEATPGMLGELYRDWTNEEPPYYPNSVDRAMSLIPDEQLTLYSYMFTAYMHDKAWAALSKDRGWASGGDDLALGRPQVELLATATSVLNDCYY